MAKKVVAMIPLKLTNQRLPGKNLLPLGNMRVCDHLFGTILKIKIIDEIYVYCSDESIKDTIPSPLKFLKRDIYFDGDQVKTLEILESFINEVDADIYVQIHVTTPFTRSESIETALYKVINEGYDSALTVFEQRTHCWFNGKPLNFNLDDVKRTQDILPVYTDTNGFCIFTKDVFKKLHRRTGNHPYFHIVDWIESADINTPEDYAFAQAIQKYLEEQV